MSYLEKVRTLSSNGYIRKWHLEGILSNIHGAYAKRILIKKKKGKSTRSKHAMREEEEGKQAAVLTTTSNTDTTKELSDEIEIQTFPLKNGVPQSPLGGSRGYIAGALKSAAKSYGTSRGARFFGILSYIERGGLVIDPEWVSLNANVEPIPREYPVVLNSFGGKTAQMFYYDCIAEVSFSINVYETAEYKTTTTSSGKIAKDETRELPFTTALLGEDDMLLLFGKLETTPIGAKGRGSIKWTNIEKIA